MYHARIVSLVILFLLLSLHSLLANAAIPKNDSLATVYVEVREEVGNTKIGISNMNVRLIAETDTLSAVSSYSGECVFRNYKPGKTVIVVSKVGYKTYRDRVQIVPGANILYIDMKPADEKLDAAVVQAEVPLVTQINDTLVYNAAAVSLMDGDKAIEILSRLPGVSVSGNRISVNGDPVARTYVNGVMIYGNDPSSAFYSLDASQVKEIKIYDEQSEADKRKGLKNSRKQTVMNVTTKNKIISAVDVVVAGSYGVDGAKDSEGMLQSRYLGAAVANFYSEKFLSYARLYAANVPVNQDLGSAAPIRMIASPMNWQPLNSYTENIYLSTGVHKFWGERVYGNNLKFDYAYNNSYGRSFQRGMTEYFQTEDNPLTSYSDTTSFSSTGASHSFSLDLSLPDTPLKTINFKNDFIIKDSRSHSVSMASKYQDGYVGYRNVSYNDYSGGDFTYSGELGWSDADNARLTPAVSINADLVRDNGENWVVDTMATAFDRRHIHSENLMKKTDVSAMASLSSVLKNTEKYTLSIAGRYTLAYYNSVSRQNTMELWQVVTPVVDVANTYDYTWNFYDQNANASLLFRTRDLEVNAEVGVRYRTQVDLERYPEIVSENYNFLSFTPMLSVFWKRNFKFSVNISSQTPSIEQLRNRIDDKNPFALTGGNPHLKQSTTVNTLVRYTAMKPSKWNLSAEVHVSYSPSVIVRKQIYFKENTILSDWNGYPALAGSMLNTFENASGALAVKEDANFKYFINRKSSFNCTADYSFVKAPQYLGVEKVMMNTHAPSISLGYDYRNRYISMKMSARTMYQHSSNNIGQTLNESLMQTFNASFYGNFLKICFGGANYSMALYRNLSGVGSDNLNHIVNAEIGIKLLKKKMSLSISGHDLLSGTSTYSNTVFNNYVVQTWVPSYGRYFMLNLKYDFSKTSGKRFRGGLVK